MNGVSKYDWLCYQFISLDITQSKFDSSECYEDRDFTWLDRIVPQGKQIRTVETLLRKEYGFLYGFKWIGDDGAVLVAAGPIDNPKARDDPDNVLQSLTLNHNQTLVGVKSYSHGYKWAKHFSF